MKTLLQSKIFMLLWVLTIFITPSQAQDYNRYLEKAKTHIDNGDYQKATDSYEIYKKLSGKTNAAVEDKLSGSNPSSASDQNKLGNDYYFGRNGVTKDYSEAAKWYRKSAEQGYASAQYNLGLCYYNGRGVTQNDTEAALWYRKAAEQGNAIAQYNLGSCYYNGRGVTKSYAEAAICYRKAAEQEHAQAQYMLGVCYYNGRGVPKSDTEAITWYRKAAEQGEKSAIETLKILEEQ